MTDYKETVLVEQDDIMIKLEGLTCLQCYNQYGLCADETLIHTVKFSNGKEVDIKMV